MKRKFDKYTFTNDLTAVFGKDLRKAFREVVNDCDSNVDDYEVAAALMEVNDEHIWTDLDSLRHEFDKNTRCVVKGTIHLWDGRHEFLERGYLFEELDKMIYPNYDQDFVLKRTGKWTFRFHNTYHDGGSSLTLSIIH